LNARTHARLDGYAHCGSGRMSPTLFVTTAKHYIKNFVLCIFNYLINFSLQDQTGLSASTLLETHYQKQGKYVEVYKISKAF
jgi:hypothetical protein